jgi:tetratricopeptide (TPR) repeat protein
MWEKTYVGIEFKVPTDKSVTAAIEKTMAGPSANDYYASAVYYLAEGKDINQAKVWMDKAISLMENPRFYHLRKQSLIYAKAGDKKGAIAIAKKSLEDAKKSENADYVKMNEDSLKEWGAK